MNCVKNKYKTDLFCIMFCLPYCRFACNAKCKEEQNVKVHEVNGKLCLQACENINPGTELLFWLEDSGIPSEMDTCDTKAVAQGIDSKSGDEKATENKAEEEEVSSSGKMIICLFD